jgi:sugar phosphate isomerase/epimerase
MSNLCLGAQLYTLREHTKSPDDFARTMHKVAEIGYKYVQVSGTCPLEPAFIAKVCADTGLKVVLTHSDFGRMLAETDRVIEEHSVYGCDALGIGGAWNCEHTYEGFLKFCETLAPVAEKIKAAGKVFLYHNHRWEFEKFEGKYAVEIIMENTDTDAVKLTFDTFWATSGGVDPAQFIERYGDRVFCTHLKDMTVKSDKVVMTEMLTGNINFDSILAACEKKGVKWHFIEQDNVYMDAFESMKISYDNLMATYPNYFGE